MSILVDMVGSIVKLLPKTKLDRIEYKVFMAEDTSLKPETTCDYGLVMGGSELRIRKALSLYHQGRFRKFLLSGGIGPMSKNRQVPESWLYYDYLMEQGIPETDVYTEPSSTNTIENLMYSMDLLSKMGVRIRNVSILIITSDYHLRRALTLARSLLQPRCKGVEFASVNMEVASKECWRYSNMGRFVVFKEYMHLKGMKEVVPRR